MYRTYTLIAKHEGVTKRTVIYGNDGEEWLGSAPEERCDHDAAMSAIPVILNKAMTDTTWANGEITLMHQGRVIHKMEAKSGGA